MTIGRKIDQIILLILLCFNINLGSCKAEEKKAENTGSMSTITDTNSTQAQKIIPAAERTELYFPLLKNKKIALVVNQTSVIGKTHLVDTLKKSGFDIVRIFGPEHGFRGKAEAGEKVKSGVDSITGIEVVSLYGDNKKPKPEQLKGIDLVIFDIQDVGVRFYTYISTMHYIMQACADNNKELIILDRPNPNNYVDGPVLKPEFKSFVGMHPIPVLHGLTVGELANMINGEKWLDSGKVCSLKIIEVGNYHRYDSYSLPIAPSPNLPNDLAIMLYPSLGLFEGTVISVARGTDFPFQAIGAPNKAYGSFTFTPKSIPGVAKNPPHEGLLCYGIDLRKMYPERGFKIRYIIQMYNASDNKEKFFNNFFNKLAGNKELQQQIKDGWTEQKIRASWEKELNAYKEIRKKYLIYQE